MKIFKYLASGIVLGIIFSISNYIIVAQEGPDAKIEPSVKTAVIKNLLENLNSAYVFEDVAKKMEADLNARVSKGEYKSVESSREFAQKLTEHLQLVSNDKHLRVRFSPAMIPVRTDVRQPTAEEIAENARYQRSTNFGFERVERLAGNVGYIELRGFFSPVLGKETVEAAMTLVSNTDALIIDLRRNGGGDPAMVALICSYFFGDQKVHLNDLYWRQGDRTDEFWTDPKVSGKKYTGKDVYILTSSRTFSGAEEFSYNLKNLKRATIVGETTGGGAHPGTSFRLSDHFSAFIPLGRAISPVTKTNWEGTGVKPDIEIKKEEALKKAYGMALEKSLAKQTDENAKAALKRLIEENKAAN
ncbi:MAG: S41 family peptidase [Pyrinomonadaceae bacterium]